MTQGSYKILQNFVKNHNHTFGVIILNRMIESILNCERKSSKVETIKKLCDGLEITIAQFFDEVSNFSEQEIQ